MTVRTPTSIDEFVRYLAVAIGKPDAEFDFEIALARQAISDSVTMVELAIVLEQELGVDLPDDLDLREASFASLYARYEGTPDA
jgi:acyl carrier protein